MPIPSFSLQASVRTVEANGFTLAYLEYEDFDRLPTILLHAGGPHKELWGPMAHELC